MDQGASGGEIEQPSVLAEQALPPDDVATEALPVVDVPVAQSVFEIPKKEKHPPVAITETGEGDISPVQPITTQRQEFPAGADKQPGLPLPAAVVSKASFGVDELIRRLKHSEAIGVFTKLAIRSEALDLVDMVGRYRQHMAGITLPRLRTGFDGLLLKILALLDNDPELAQAIYQAKEQLWQSLLEVKT